MNFSEYTHPGKWTDLYAELPDDLAALAAVVKNLAIHPVDVNRYGIRVTRERSLTLRQLYTTECMLDDLFQTPPVSLVAARSPYRRLVEWCDYQAVLFASFGQYKGYEVRTRCGFASYLKPGRWTYHWVNEVRAPFYDDWTLLDIDRQCSPKREEFRTGAAWWSLKNTAGVSRLVALHYHGVEAVKHTLLCDFNALNRHELVHSRWLDPETPSHSPAIYRTLYTQLGSRQKMRLDHIAAAIRDEDEARVSTLFNDINYLGQFRPAAARSENGDAEPHASVAMPKEK